MHRGILLAVAGLCAALPLHGQDSTATASARPALRRVLPMVSVPSAFTRAVQAATRTETGRPGPR